MVCTAIKSFHVEKFSAFNHNTAKTHVCFNDLRHSESLQILLTVGVISDVRRQRDQRQVWSVDVLIHILLGFHGLHEGEKPGGERCDEDGEHAEIQNVPELHDVFPRPLRPQLFTLRPHHSCRNAVKVSHELSLSAVSVHSSRVWGA